jgi:FG-GAP-like repeat
MQKRWWHRVAFAMVLALSAAQAKAQDIAFGTLPALQVATPIPGSTHVPGDIDGNGISDLLWFNPTTSQFAYWLMDTDSTGAVTRVGSRTFNITPGYFVGAVGDFNGDGLADVVFTSNNHDLYLWTNNGAGGFTSKQLASYPAGWLLVGAGDIDGDGQDDLLWLNPSQCEFGYWLMKNGVPTTTKAVKITCGYYPLSIGYYTPTNRLSIVWTSALNDLYIWDSTASGFVSYPLGGYGQGQTLVAFGGGYAGRGMSLITEVPDSSADGFGIGFGSSLSRLFNTSFQQSSYSTNGIWDGGVALPLSSAGYLIEGNNINLTGVIYLGRFYQEGNVELEVCPTVDNGNLGNIRTGPAPNTDQCPTFSFPQGWYVIGAMANGIVPVTNSNP